MVAQVIVLADYRTQRAQVTVTVSADPLAAWRAWWVYWGGGKPKAREPKTAEVRAFGGGIK